MKAGKAHLSVVTNRDLGTAGIDVTLNHCETLMGKSMDLIWQDLGRGWGKPFRQVQGWQRGGTEKR